MTRIQLLLPERTADMKEVVGINVTDQRGIRKYFLAGPVRGGDDWQAAAIALLEEKDPDCHIACPCRYDKNHPLYEYAIDARSSPDKKLFPSQTLWERYYLQIAAQHGCIIFWLPEESTLHPREKADGPYARDTYGELGRWSILSALSRQFNKNRVNLVAGAEDGFPGLSVIQKNFTDDHGELFTFHKTLEETIVAAVRIGEQTNPKPFEVAY